MEERKTEYLPEWEAISEQWEYGEAERLLCRAERVEDIAAALRPSTASALAEW